MQFLGVLWSVITWVLGLFGIGKPQPPDPHKQGEDEQRARDGAEAARKAYEAELAIQEAERKAREEAEKRRPTHPVRPGDDIS